MRIAVAGCGISGMAGALLLARQGHEVALYERFDTPQPIGSGLMLQPTGLAVLEQLGLAEAARAAGARVTQLFGRSEPSGRVALDVHYAWLRREGACGYGIHRAALFELLHHAVGQADIPIHAGCAVAGCGDGRLRFEGQEVSPTFDLIVNATGAWSPLTRGAARPLAFGALWTSLDAAHGFAPDVLEQRYVRAHTMCGVLPIGRPPGATRDQVAFFWSLRADRLDAWRAAGLKAWKDEVRALWPATAPLLDQIDRPERLTFARYTHRTVRRPDEDRLIHIGDAWHSTSPQLGQGANNGLLDAFALAQAIGEGGDQPAALHRMVAARWAHVRLYQLMSLALTPAFQSEGALMPFLRDRAVPPFARRWPATRIQAAMLAGTLGGPLRRLGL